MKIVGLLMVLSGFVVFIVYGILFLMAVWSIPGVAEFIFAWFGLAFAAVGAAIIDKM